mgnify:CR=1 FL=1
MQHILIVEDDLDIQELLKNFLQEVGYAVTLASDGIEAISLFASTHFDLILLDIMLPKIDGFTVCELIRKQSSVPIIMLTALNGEEEQIRGLDLQVDDYITKPFSPSELVARVDAIYRRVSLAKDVEQQNDEVVSGPFVLNTKSRTLSKNGKMVDLTQVEFQILEFFMKNPNTALERSAILDEVWGSNYFGDVKIVDVNIRRLRMKIEEEPSNPRYLQTVWGFGYKWVV